MERCPVKKKRRSKNRVYSLEFKLSALERILRGEDIRGLSRILEVPRSLLYYWLERYRQEATERLRGPGRPAFDPERRVAQSDAELVSQRAAELERKVGQQEVEIDFLRKAFERVKELRRPGIGSGGTASTERSEA